ncbi:MAG: HEAT repeat domain-containing protein [Methylacidiphilales bacterium]|nr:HEAT repeat domain-containing protein [Candidatus Methylacidiphilales bacterium]
MKSHLDLTGYYIFQDKKRLNARELIEITRTYPYESLVIILNFILFCNNHLPDHFLLAQALVHLAMINNKKVKDILVVYTKPDVAIIQCAAYLGLYLLTGNQHMLRYVKEKLNSVDGDQGRNILKLIGFAFLYKKQIDLANLIIEFSNKFYQAALEVIGEIQDQYFLGFLFEQLRVSDTNKKSLALKTLTRMNYDGIVDLLLYELKKDENGALKETIIRSLGKVGDLKSCELLFKWIEENRFDEKDLILESIGDILGRYRYSEDLNEELKIRLDYYSKLLLDYLFKYIPILNNFKTEVKDKNYTDLINNILRCLNDYENGHILDILIRSQNKEFINEMIKIMLMYYDEYAMLLSLYGNKLGKVVDKKNIELAREIIKTGDDFWVFSLREMILEYAFHHKDTDTVFFIINKLGSYAYLYMEDIGLSLLNLDEEKGVDYIINNMSNLINHDENEPQYFMSIYTLFELISRNINEADKLLTMILDKFNKDADMFRLLITTLLSTLNQYSMELFFKHSDDFINYVRDVHMRPLAILDHEFILNAVFKTIKENDRINKSNRNNNIIKLLVYCLNERSIEIVRKLAIDLYDNHDIIYLVDIIIRELRAIGLNKKGYASLL